MDDQNITQNPILTEDSIPSSPKEPTTDASIPKTDSVLLDITPEVPEAPRESVTPTLVKDDNSVVSQPESQVVEPAQTAQIEEIPIVLEQKSEPIQTSEIGTAQTVVNEPLGELLEPNAPTTAPTPTPTEPIPQPVQSPQPRNLAKELFAKALEAIQFRKRKKLDRVMTLFAKRTNITNDEVEKFLHVSDATATRYLEILEKENKIKQSGKTGKGVSYTKI